jgi:hypothetical protein
VFSEREKRTSKHTTTRFCARSREEEGAETERTSERERIDIYARIIVLKKCVSEFYAIDRKRTIHIKRDFREEG